MINTENKYFIYDKPRKVNLKYIARFFYVKIENLFYRACYKLAGKKSSDKKYNVTICAIFKNEGLYLKEWIEYHLIVGVDHFYMYNNNSTDKYLDVLKPYINSGKVTLINWPYQQAQIKAYRDCIEKRRSEANWIGFIDLDEFIVPIKDDTIYDFLRRFSDKPAVKLYWQLFGTSGKVDRDRSGLVTEDFTVCWNKYDEVGKCFYNTAYDFNPHFRWNGGFHHGLWANWRGINLPPVNCFNEICQRGFEKVKTKDFPIQLNHYFTKSYNEYVEKASKGDVFFEKNPHNLDFFYRHEMLCGKADYHIFKYLVKLKLAMEKEN